MTSKQRIHCSNEKFLEAVYSSKTYAEIASKTNQKLSSTMARYSKTKKALLSRGIKLPEMERKKLGAAGADCRPETNAGEIRRFRRISRTSQPTFGGARGAPCADL